MGAKRARPATPAYLQRVALSYLERYGGSIERVRRILTRRVRRSVEELGTDPEVGAQAVEAVIDELCRLGLLDDARLAEARVRALRRRGKSARAIRAALAGRGIDPSLCDRALEREDGADAELTAARALVRRRRLGPHRDEASRALERQRDLARLARAGFSYAIAVRALREDD
jgi:regulatory protein